MQAKETEQRLPPTSGDAQDEIAPHARQIVAQLEAKWDAQINALQASGSIDLRDLEAEIRKADQEAARTLDIQDIQTAILGESNQVARAIDIRERETKRLSTPPVRLSYRSTFPMALEKNRSSRTSGELRLEELPTTVLSAVMTAAQSHRVSAGSTETPLERVQFDEFITTLQHTAQLSPSQRMAIVEFTHGTRAATRVLPFFIQGAISELPTVELPSAAALAANRRLALPYHWATMAVLALFVGIEVALILSQQIGSFGDEGIYIFAGMRTIEGYGLADNYLTWFAGSLLWPVLAASGYIAGGLIGARLIALACTTLAIAATSKASRNLFGEPAQLWTALTLAMSGPTLFLAHLAVYDQVALAGIAVSLWAISNVGNSDERRWLIIAALAFAIAVIAKYPMILCLAPLVGVVFALRQKRAHADLFILLFASAALLLIYALPLRGQLVQFLLWRQENNPSFGATTATVRFSILWYGGLAWLLAGIGWLVGWVGDRKKRLLTTVLMGGLLLWPAYHLLINNVVSEEKHQVFGFLFGYPIAGALFASIWLKQGSWRWLRRGVVVLVLFVMAYAGTAQALQMDRAWPDTRPVAQYLTSHVQPGQRILSNDAASYQMVLYRNGNLESPWDIYDTYRISHGEFNESLCSANWFVDEAEGSSWPESVRQQIQSCGTFKQVFASTSTVAQLGRSLDFVTYPVHITVWFNVATH